MNSYVVTILRTGASTKEVCHALEANKPHGEENCGVFWKALFTRWDNMDLDGEQVAMCALKNRITGLNQSLGKSKKGVVDMLVEKNTSESLLRNVVLAGGRPSRTIQDAKYSKVIEEAKRDFELGQRCVFFHDGQPLTPREEEVSGNGLEFILDMGFCQAAMFLRQGDSGCIFVTSTQPGDLDQLDTEVLRDVSLQEAKISTGFDLGNQHYFFLNSGYDLMYGTQDVANVTVRVAKNAEIGRTIFIVEGTEVVLVCSAETGNEPKVSGLVKVMDHWNTYSFLDENKENAAAVSPPRIET
jgi:hypothetical protein